MPANENGPRVGAQEPSDNTPLERSRMVTTVEGLTQAMRRRNDPNMATAFRLIQVELAAKRMLELAFQARNAYAADSFESALTILNAIEHETNHLVDTHVRHAKVQIDGDIVERAA